jgi:hypothetical protein
VTKTRNVKHFKLKRRILAASTVTTTHCKMRTSLETLLLWSTGLIASVFAKDCPIADTSIIAHAGTPVGTEQVVDGVTFYISKPKCKTRTPRAAVVYLTDVFGIQLAQNKL